jgi:hypothetical protein
VSYLIHRLVLDSRNRRERLTAEEQSLKRPVTGTASKPVTSEVQR